MARQPPLLRAYYETAFNISTTPKSVAVDWLAGDRITVLGITAGASTTINTPTAAGLTFVADGAVGTTGQCWANSWTATAAADGTAVALAAAITGSAQVWGFAVWVHGASEGWGNRATSAAAAKTASLPRALDNSAVLVIIGDFSAGAVTGYAWTPSGQTEREAALEAAGGYTVYAADWPDQGTAGTSSYGITGTASTGQHTIIAREVLGSGGVPDDPTFRYRQQAPGGRGPSTGPQAWVGQAGYPDVPAITAQTIGVAQAVEADTATAITGQKLRAVGQASATSTAQPITVAKVRTIGQAVETDTATAIGQQKLRAIGQAQSTSSATALTPQKLRAVVQAVEADTARPVTRQGAADITIVGVVSGLSNAAVASYSPDVWPAVLAGDLIVLYATTGTTGPPTITATAPGGAAYSSGADVVSGTVLRTVRLSRFAATDNEGAPTIAHSPNGNGTVTGVVLRGADPSTPVDVAEQTAFTAATQTAITLPSLTTVTARAWSLAGYAARVAAPPYPLLTEPAAFTEQSERRTVGASGAGSATSSSTRNANPLPVNTYGGESFSHDIAGGARQTIIHTAIRPAPATGGHTVAVGQAVEADSATVVGRQKLGAIGQALETDTATQLTRRKLRPAGQAVATDTATAIVRRKGRTTGQAVETDTATALTRRKLRAVAQAVEADVAQPITRAGAAHIIGQATEADTATAILRRKTRLLAQAVETDTSTAILRRKLRAVAQAVEADTATATVRRKARSVGQASSANTATAILRRKLRAVAQAFETDTAVALVPKGTVRLLGQAVEADLAFGIVGLTFVGVTRPVDGTLSAAEASGATSTPGGELTGLSGASEVTGGMSASPVDVSGTLTGTPT